MQEDWKNLQQQFKNQKNLGKIKSGEDPLFVFLTDLLAGDIQRLVIDEKETFKKTTKWLKTLIPYLSESRAFILSRHGALTWGESLKEAYLNMERLEHSSQMIYLAEALGGSGEIPEKELQELLKIRLSSNEYIK